MTSPTLPEAAGSGDLELCRALLRAGADVNFPGYYTPLQSACTLGHVELAKLLIEAGASVSSSEMRLARPLVAAARIGSVELCRLLIEAGADVSEAGPSGASDSALMCAARSDRADVCRFLIAAGASVHSLDAEGLSVLHHAVHANSVGAFKVLIEAGVDTSVCRPHRGRAAQTLLELAISCDARKVIDFLLFECANGPTRGEGAVKAPLLASSAEALMLAARYDWLDQVKSIIGAGEDPSAVRECHGMPALTAFQTAVRFNSTKVMQYFLCELAEDPAQRTLSGRTMHQLAGKHVEAKQLLQAAKTVGAISGAVVPEAGQGALAASQRCTAPAPI